MCHFEPASRDNGTGLAGKMNNLHKIFLTKTCLKDYDITRLAKFPDVSGAEKPSKTICQN